MCSGREQDDHSCRRGSSGNFDASRSGFSGGEGSHRVARSRPISAADCEERAHAAASSGWCRRRCRRRESRCWCETRTDASSAVARADASAGDDSRLSSGRHAPSCRAGSLSSCPGSTFFSQVNALLLSFDCVLIHLLVLVTSSHMCIPPFPHDPKHELMILSIPSDLFSECILFANLNLYIFSPHATTCMLVTFNKYSTFTL